MAFRWRGGWCHVNFNDSGFKNLILKHGEDLKDALFLTNSTVQCMKLIILGDLKNKMSHRSIGCLKSMAYYLNFPYYT